MAGRGTCSNLMISKNSLVIFGKQRKFLASFKKLPKNLNTHLNTYFLKTKMADGNGRVTLAVLGQRVEDYIQENDKDHAEIKSDLKEIKDILVNGSHKISNNTNAITNHLGWHQDQKEEAKTHWIVIGTIAGLAGVVGAFLKGLLWR